MSKDDNCTCRGATNYWCPHHGAATEEDHAEQASGKIYTDITTLRMFGVVISRLLFDEMTPDSIADLARETAREIGRPTDADSMPCKTCGQLVEERWAPTRR